MTLHKINFIFFLVILALTSFSQTNASLPIKRRAPLPINFKDLNIEIREFKLNDTTTITKDSSIYKFFITDYLGKSSICCYNYAGQIKFKGQYSNSLGVLTEYQIADVILDKGKKIVTHSFYQPLRDGKWTFCDANRSCLDSIYSEGIILKN